MLGLNLYLKEKSQDPTIFQQFRQMIIQFLTSIQIIHNDNGREYLNSILGDFLKKKGIFRQSSCVQTPQRNAFAKQKICHLLEVAHALIFTSHVPINFWGEAVLTASYLINRLPSKIPKFQTPLNILLKS